MLDYISRFEYSPKNSINQGTHQLTPVKISTNQNDPRRPTLQVSIKLLEPPYNIYLKNPNVPRILTTGVSARCKLSKRELTPDDNPRAMVNLAFEQQQDKENPDKTNLYLRMTLEGLTSDLCSGCLVRGECLLNENYFTEIAKLN